MKKDRHREIVQGRMRRSPRYRRAFLKTLHQIDLAMLVREMREKSGLSQSALASKASTTQSVIARLEDAEYTGHSLKMLERLAAACDVHLTLHAERKPDFNREIVLVWDKTRNLQPASAEMWGSVRSNIVQAIRAAIVVKADLPKSFSNRRRRWDQPFALWELPRLAFPLLWSLLVRVYFL